MELDILQLEIGALSAKDAPAGGDGHVLEGVLAVVSEAGSLDSGNLKPNLQSVQDQSGQGLTVNIFGHDDQRALVLEKKG